MYWLGPGTLVLVLLSGALSENVTVEIGKDVTLTCRGPPNDEVLMVAWNRTDLPEDDFVFLYQDNSQAGEECQKTYYGRVMLNDPEMKDGNASVVLKNVTLNDTGTFQCGLGLKNGQRRRRNALDIFNTIKLRVTNRGHTGPRAGMEGSHMKLTLAIIGVVVVAAAVIGFVMYRCSRGLGVQHDSAGLESAEMEAVSVADSPNSE